MSISKYIYVTDLNRMKSTHNLTMNYEVYPFKIMPVKRYSEIHTSLCQIKSFAIFVKCRPELCLYCSTDKFFWSPVGTEMITVRKWNNWKSIKLAETIYSPFKTTIFDLFRSFPATFGILFSEENSWNQLNKWKKILPEKWNVWRQNTEQKLVK